MTSPTSNYTSVLILLSALFFIHCGDGLPDDPFANMTLSLDVDASSGNSKLDISQARTNVFNFPFETLSNQEEKGIRFVREEEKVAVDYYNAMNVLFPSEGFDKVAQGEKSHFDVSGLALDKYNLVDPTEGMVPGAFTSQSLQAHYDELIREGSPSLIDAYLTGAKLQEANLRTIQNQLDRVANNRDLRNVYDALRIATRNHLRMMVNAVKANGGSYSPLFITEVAFRDIVNSEFEG